MTFIFRCKINERTNMTFRTNFACIFCITSLVLKCHKWYTYLSLGSTVIDNYVVYQYNQYYQPLELILFCAYQHSQFNCFWRCVWHPHTGPLTEMSGSQMGKLIPHKSALLISIHLFAHTLQNKYTVAVVIFNRCC